MQSQTKSKVVVNSGSALKSLSCAGGPNGGWALASQVVAVAAGPNGGWASAAAGPNGGW